MLVLVFTFSTSERPKVARDCQFPTLFDCECTSYHNGMHFYNISTSKSSSGPRPSVLSTSRHQNVHFFHISTSKNGPRPSVFNTFDLTSNCASCHSGVHFFDVSTSKSAPDPLCFSHFYFDRCFAPQQHALFRHLNFQKVSDNEVFLAF